MLAVEEALARIVAAFQPQPAEWVHLAAAHGRVLAEDLVATRDQPPQAVSAMDGYAVRAADLASGSAELRLLGQAPAGGRFEGRMGPGEAVRIFTGAALPAGADAVALQENAEATGDRVRLEGRVEAGTFVRPAGPRFPQGRARPARRPSPRRPRSRLRRRPQPRLAAGAPAAAHRAAGDRRRAGDAGPGAGRHPDRQLQQRGARRHGRGLGRAAVGPRDRARRARSARRLRRAGGRHGSRGHARRGLGRRARPGAQRARGARPRARLLADRDAPRQAADVRHDRRREAPRAAGQPGLGRSLRGRCSCAP